MIVADTTEPTFARLALDAALAGARVLDAYGEGRDLSVGIKTSRRDLVTDADRASEEAVLRHVRRYRPRDAIVAEESGEHRGDGAVRWIVDPLDGTTNFVHRRPEYAVAVAAEREAGHGAPGRAAAEAMTDMEGPMAGAIVRPAYGDWVAGDEEGVIGSAGPPAVSTADRLDEALICVGVSLNPSRRAVTFGLLERLSPQVRDFRRTGSASCELFAVATGALDAYIGLDSKPWDIAPGWAVVRAAGGRCRSFTTAAGHTAYVVGAAAIVDRLAPIVARHA